MTQRSRIEVDIAGYNRGMDYFVKKQVPFAAAKTLTQTVGDAKRAVDAQLDKKLDRPTPFTRRAVGIQRATKKRLTATIFIKDIQAEYLKYAVLGGTRTPRKQAIPVPGEIRLNKFGNIPGMRGGKKIERLLEKPNVFQGEIKGVYGIWQRLGKGRNRRVKLLIALEREASYERRLPFYEIVQGVVTNRLQKNFNANLKQALATARR